VAHAHARDPLAEPREQEGPFLARRLANDPVLREEVSLARTLGISYKRLRGWEPTTVYEHDDAGRLVSSRPETEWDATEVAWMQALGDYEATLCEHCGLPRDVCHARDMENRVKVRPPERCHVTTALLREQEKRAKGNEAIAKQTGAAVGAYDRALSWGVTIEEQPPAVAPTGRRGARARAR
jgi:hypothetical protein